MTGNKTLDLLKKQKKKQKKQRFSTEILMSDVLQQFTLYIRHIEPTSNTIEDTLS